MSWFYQPVFAAAQDTGPPPPTAGYIKVWMGSDWQLKPVKYWTGSVWEQKPLKFWNGGSWVTA